MTLSYYCLLATNLSLSFEAKPECATQSETWGIHFARLGHPFGTVVQSHPFLIASRVEISQNLHVRTHQKWFTTPYGPMTIKHRTTWSTRPITVISWDAYLVLSSRPKAMASARHQECRRLGDVHLLIWKTWLVVDDGFPARAEFYFLEFLGIWYRAMGAAVSEWYKNSPCILHRYRIFSL